MTSPDAMIEALLADRSTTALLCDFDGTLARIVDHPDDAVPVPGAVAALRVLGDSLGRVGVVSGRPVEFLAAVLPVPGLALVGQHGMERLAGDDVVAEPSVVPFAPAVAAAAGELEAEFPGLYVERKGVSAVTVHWRTAADAGESAAGVIDAVAARHGLAVHPGRMSRELRPPLPIDKGIAVASLLEGCTVAVFAGDDRGDLAAFDALDRATADGRLHRALRVGVGSDEAPPELLERADLVVAGPDEFVGLLAELADRL